LNDVVALRERLTSWVSEHGAKARDAFRVLYVAILGRNAGLPVFDAMQFIGAEKTAERLRAASDELAARTAP